MNPPKDSLWVVEYTIVAPGSSGCPAQVLWCPTLSIEAPLGTRRTGMGKWVADAFLTQNLSKIRKIFYLKYIQNQFIATCSQVIKERSLKIKKSQIKNISVPNTIEILFPLN